MKKFKALIGELTWILRSKLHFYFIKLDEFLHKIYWGHLFMWLFMVIGYPFQALEKVYQKRLQENGKPSFLGKVGNFFLKGNHGIYAFFRAIQKFFRKQNLGILTRMPSWMKATFYLLPALSLLAIFTFYPIFNSFLISFYTGYNIQRGDFLDFTLIGNYQRVLAHANFSQAVYNTALIVFISVPVTIIVGLLIAVALNAIKPLRGFFQSIFFLPYVTNSIAIGLVFAFMFKGNQNDLTNLGLVNQLLTWIGLQPIVWIGAGATYWSALTVILVYSVWNGLAFKIIVFLAGIQGIDKQYYQAAQIDGASKSKSFRRITVPMISPMIFYILITSVIGAFKTYSSVVAIIGVTGTITTGATGQINLKTIVFYIYDYIALAGQDGLMSLASAAAIILFGIILFFTVIQLQVGKRRVHY